MTSFSLGLSIVSAIHRGPRPVWDWTPESLAPIFWAGGMQPATPARLFQEAAGTTPAAAAGQPVGKIARLKGSVDLSQATALSRPTLARWPKGGRQNLVTYSELPNDLNQGGLSGGGAGSVDHSTMEGYDGAAWIKPATTTTAFSYRQIIPPLAVGVPLVLSFVYEADDGGPPQLTAANDGYVAPAGTAPQYTSLGGNRWLVVYKANSQSTNFYGVAKATTANARSFKITAFQVTLGTELQPYQKVVDANTITETGISDLWHLYDDGGDSLPLVLPAGEYGLAWVDHLGAVSSATVTSDGVAAIDLLRAERQADVLIRAGAITAPELTALTGYWEGIYK